MPLFLILETILYLTPLQAAVHASPNSASTWAVLGAAGANFRFSF